MQLILGLVLVVALTTLVKLATRRLFRGPSTSRRAPRPAGEDRRPGPAPPSGKPKPTARTNAKSQRRH